MNERYRVELLGDLRLQSAERTICRFYTRKAGALLAFLAYYRNRRHSRDALAEMLWPDAEPAAGRLSLRVTLSSLRRQLEPPGMPTGSVLFADRFCVGLNPAAVTTDAAEFEAALASVQNATRSSEHVAEALIGAVALYGGELLSGYDESWVLAERGRLAEAYGGALERLTAILEAAGDRARAIDYAHRALAWDPLREEMHHRLMRLYAAAGRPMDALRQYTDLERLLREELGETPSPPVQALAERLRRRAVSPPNRTKAPCPPRPKAIAADHPQSRPGVPRNPGLPLQFTRLFGREEEIARLSALLCATLLDNGDASPRLISLTGPGGCGKTRLAIETAWRLSEEFHGILRFVPLANLSDAGRIADAIAEALPLERAPKVTVLEQVAAFFSAQRTLLLLDNLEHLLPYGSDVVQALIEGCPGLTCLVTSRQRLGLAGEQEFPVPPLPVPPGTEIPELLFACPSVRLFVDRAQHVRPDFQVTARNAPDLSALCRQLEGMPLALELAAGWAQTLTPAQMVERLSRQRNVLINRDRNAPPRHRSLRATIAWSYELLPADLQQFFACLSVFRGGWTLEMAESVCREAQALEFLIQLRERSLILVEETVLGGRPQMRYRMLETLREYSWERLGEQERFSLQHRHLDALLRMAEEAERQLCGPERALWLEHLEAEGDNLRAALRCALGGSSEATGTDGERPEVSAALSLRLAASLWRFWQRSGRLPEGKEWLDRALARSQDAPAELRAKALYGCGVLTFYQGGYEQAQTLFEESLRLYRECGDRRGGSDVLSFVCQATELNSGDARQNRAQLEECLCLCRATGNRRGLAAALCQRAKVEQYQGDHGAAQAFLAESLHLYRALGDQEGVATVLFRRGDIALYRGDYAAARSDWEESLTYWRRSGDRVGLCGMLGHLAYLAARQADYARAEAACAEALDLYRKQGSRSGVAAVLWQRGNLARVRGDFHRARRLHEESLALRREMGERWGIADSLSSLGQMALWQGDLTGARAFQEEALALRREGVDRLDIALALTSLGDVARYEGKADEAARLYEESLTLSREAESKFGRAGVLQGLGRLCCRRGDIAGAVSPLKESLRLFQEMGDRRGMAEGLEGLAEAVAVGGAPERAALLWGAAAALREAIGAPLPPIARRDYDRALRAARRVMGASLFESVRAEGAEMSVGSAVEYALQAE